MTSFSFSVKIQKIKKQNSEDNTVAQQLIEMELEFSIDRVHFKMSQLKSGKNQSDEDIFYFKLDDLNMTTTVRTYDLIGEFNIGGLNCRHLLQKTKDGNFLILFYRVTQMKIGSFKWL